MSRPPPCLLPSRQDDDLPAMRRKKPRHKKAVDKWNLLWFIPTNVLNNRELVGGFKQGKREGFTTYSRLACKGCRHAFHKASGFRLHRCTGLSSFLDRGTSKSSLSSSYSSTPKQLARSQSLGSRKSSRVSKPRFTLEEDDDIEIVGDTELDKKNEKRIDKNFSKMSLAGKLRAIEEYRTSSQFMEEEELAVDIVAKKKGKQAKKKATVDEDSDIEVIEIEVIDIEEETKVSKTSQAKASKRSKSRMSNNQDNSEEVTKVLDEISETKAARSNEEKLLHEDSDNTKKSDFITIKSASGKTMRVEREKYDRVKKSFSPNAIEITPMTTRSGRKTFNDSKENLLSEDDDIEIFDLEDSLDSSPLSKRKKEKRQEPTRSSKRLRSRG